MNESRTADTDDRRAASMCGCCGKDKPQPQLLRLGARPEAAVCVDCAMNLRRRAGAAQAGNPVLRQVHAAGSYVRRGVMAAGVQKNPVIGPALRWVNRRLPF